MGEGRFLLEGEEIFCCSQVGYPQATTFTQDYSIKCFGR
ncbi:MAG: hypothetical protein OJF50_001527 [Nitrospira sp.]|nr:hypothetical protein [Nitrospira sp.]